jgi:hypothetical protein
MMGACVGCIAAWGGVRRAWRGAGRQLGPAVLAGLARAALEGARAAPAA